MTMKIYDIIEILNITKFIRWLATAVAQRPELETIRGCWDSPS